MNEQSLAKNRDALRSDYSKRIIATANDHALSEAVRLQIIEDLMRQWVDADIALIRSALDRTTWEAPKPVIQCLFEQCGEKPCEGQTCAKCGDGPCTGLATK